VYGIKKFPPKDFQQKIIYNPLLMSFLTRSQQV